MAEYSVDYLTRLDSWVDDFECAFEAWMDTQVESDHLTARGLFPTVWPKQDADPVRIRELELAVARVAGPASQAVKVTGTYLMVQGIGPVDPLANWMTMSSPKAMITARDVRTTAATVHGRLAVRIAEAQEDRSDLPAFSPAFMHRTVWAGAAPSWLAHQYRVAVREGTEALTAHWKHQLGRHDVDGTAFWQQALSSEPAQPGKPRLRWPGDQEDRTARSIRGGLEPLARSLSGLATGLTQTVRNPATHSRDELTEQEAMESLAALSLLGRLLDQCEIERHDKER